MLFKEPMDIKLEVLSATPSSSPTFCCSQTTLTRAYNSGVMMQGYSFNQAVQVLYGNAWVTGVIIGGLHPVGQHGQMGYVVKFNVGGRAVEMRFYQEDVRAVVSDIY